uniref:Ig-like domain-containing protein n=1 Tax=Pelusios castaneus TaxID=367368 RepID=A0A8C8SLR0_9SAUR
IHIQIWSLLTCPKSLRKYVAEVAMKGQSVTLHCNFSTIDTNPYLFWYRQLLHQPPEHILTKTKFSASDQTLVQEKFSASLYMENKTVPLKIESVSQQDSAVYYCALRPTLGESCISTHTKSQLSCLWKYESITEIQDCKGPEKSCKPDPCTESGPSFLPFALLYILLIFIINELFYYSNTYHIERTVNNK